MKCTCCGEETNIQYCLDDAIPAFQGMCRHCALNWSECSSQLLYLYIKENDAGGSIFLNEPQKESDVE